MRKNIFRIVACCLLGFSVQSCSDFLDVNPGLGLTEDEVFTTYKNFTSYFDYVFSSDQRSTNISQAYPMYVNFNDRRFPFSASTDAADTGRRIRAQTELKVCKLSQETCNDFTFNTSRNALCVAMFKIIRIANRTIENIDRLTDATPVQKADLLGQAYFVRAYAHFALCRFCGGMPYIESSYYDDWDLPRLSNYDTYLRCVEDFDKAYDCFVEAKKVRRDPFPGVSGHLTGTDLERPNGVAAKAMKARALLYAASPLSNQNGDADWIAAAEASADAINIALEYKYSLLPMNNYTDNFYGKSSTNETIWGWSTEGGSLTAIFAYPQSGGSGSSGICPTQNFVDRYETADGFPLNTEEDRTKAIAAGAYKEQDPYSNRDPRFDMTIVHDGSKTKYVDGVINIYYDPKGNKGKGNWPQTKISGTNVAFGLDWGKSGSNGYTSTGYYSRKQWRGSYQRKDVKYWKLDPLVRLAELYLDYAEAVNEVYGPTGKTSNSNLTAVDAINVVRSRVNMPDVKSEYTIGKDLFRERIHNERCVELAYEGMHYYYDIRRWKTAPKLMTQVLEGMYITSCAKDAGHPNGRNYERMAIPDNRQCTWKDCMYYWPFPDSEANKMVKFVNKEKWQ